VLLGGSVWAAHVGHTDNHKLQALLARDCRIYAMHELLAACGINTQQLLSGVTAIDYPELVALTVQHSVIQTWC
jgi:tRNA 2-thiouridine synthesizing protein B